jgi:hypothetical protein
MGNSFCEGNGGRIDWLHNPRSANLKLQMLIKRTCADGDLSVLRRDLEPA